MTQTKLALIKTFKQHATQLLTGASLLLAATFAHAYDASWDGNHPQAKSEAWTWMGHLQELQGSGATQSLGKNGVGFIYYYTRNNTGSMGDMNFRSSSLTSTIDGAGQSYQTHTIYQARYRGSEFRARTSVLDLSFSAGQINDQVRAEDMNADDTQKLNNLLKLYPGLKIANGFTPKKEHFQVTEEDGTSMDLEFYSIWPVVAPPGGQLRFLGQDGTYEFSEPMLVTTGTYNGKPVAGLSFLDRQWAQDYFGAQAQAGLSSLLKYAHPLRFAHSWSAFHAYNERTHEWSFFHLWHQWERADKVADQLTDYSDLLWMKNGTESGLVSSADYRWYNSGYVQNQGMEVLLDYPMGRVGFFPSRANFVAGKLGLKAELRAEPAFQSLNQPIPFSEAYASGEGTWNGDHVRLQGRLESSRLLFRTQEYAEMLRSLRSQTDDTWKQPELQTWLQDQIKSAQSDNSPLAWIRHRLAVLASMMEDMDLKMAIFGDIISGEKPAADPADADVTVYR